jgi:hypothetical protein
MATTTSGKSSRRTLWLGLGGCALLALCFCVIAGVVGGYLLYQRQPPPVAVEGNSVEYVLDASPRMGLPSQGGTRLTVARGVLAEIIRPADPTVIAGLRVFGTGASTASCQDTDLLVPLGPSSQQLISQKASALDAGKSTDSALAQAIVNAIRDLATKKGQHSLVVVTGGADSCNPEASQVVAQEAKRTGIDLETYLIGFEVSDTEAQAIKVVADQTPKAHFLDAPDEKTLRTTLRGVQDRIDHPPAQYAKQSACDYPYFPMRKGASWEYTQGDQTISQKVTGVTGDANNATATLQIDIGQAASVTGEWTCSPDGVTSSVFTDFQIPDAAASGAQIKMTSNSGALLLPPEKLAPGATWNSDYTMAVSMDAGGQAFNMTYEVHQEHAAVGVETITTTAGAFDAIRVEVKGKIAITGLPANLPAGLMPSEIPIGSTEWYARGVGLVRSTSTTGQGEDRVLTKFSVP